MTTPTQKPNSTDQEMSLVAHLLELRDRLVRGVLAIIVVFLVLFPFANDLFTFIAEPLTRFLPDGNKMLAIGVISPFLTPLKLALIAAIYIAMPFLLYQVWSFIAPALYQNEKRLAAPLLFASTFLFYAGGAFVFFVVFPLVFQFMSGTTPDGVEIGTDIQVYLDFVIGMFFAFGLAFQVPVITVLLVITRIVSAEKMRHARPYIIVGAFIIAAIITPPDVISQTLLAVPMWLMYEAGLWFGERMVKARKAELEQQTATTAATDEGAENTTEVGKPAANALETDADFERAFAEVDAQRAALDQPAEDTAQDAHSDEVLDNRLETDDDFERAFAAIDEQREQLDAASAEQEQADSSAMATTESTAETASDTEAQQDTAAALTKPTEKV